jgi:hypothetical protein
MKFLLNLQWILLNYISYIGAFYDTTMRLWVW